MKKEKELGMSVTKDLVNPLIRRFGQAFGKGVGGEMANRSKNTLFSVWDRYVTKPAQMRSNLIVLTLPPDRSSRFNLILWDGENLGVEFRDGKRYVYKCVPRKIYQDFVVAPSPGKFYDDFIQGRYLKYDEIPNHMKPPKKKN